MQLEGNLTRLMHDVEHLQRQLDLLRSNLSMRIDQISTRTVETNNLLNELLNEQACVRVEIQGLKHVDNSSNSGTPPPLLEPEVLKPSGAPKIYKINDNGVVQYMISKTNHPMFQYHKPGPNPALEQNTIAYIKAQAQATQFKMPSIHQLLSLEPEPNPSVTNHHHAHADSPPQAQSQAPPQSETPSHTRGPGT